MDVIDKYLHRLRLFLPKDQRDDILSELSGEIRSRVAEDEQRLGRPLTADEQAALIAYYGHPLLFAARYWPQSYLIGPTLYPYYWPMLRVALGLSIAVHVVAALVLAMTGATWPDVGRSLSRSWDAALAVFAWTTAVFWIADRFVARGGLEKWRPGTDAGPLSRDAGHIANGASQTAHRAVRDVDHALRDVRCAFARLPRVPPFAQFLVNAVVTAWWLVALRVPTLVFGPAASVIGFAPIWERLYVPIAVLAALGLVRHYLALTRPDLGRALAIMQTAIRGGALIVLYFILSAREWVVFRGTTADRARYNVLIDIDDRQVPLLELINYSIAVLLIAVGILCIAGIVQTLRRRAARAAS